jgi:hypothetical protein
LLFAEMKLMKNTAARDTRRAKTKNQDERGIRNHATNASIPEQNQGKTKAGDTVHAL